MSATPNHGKPVVVPNANESPGDGAWADDLTEERDATPVQREEGAEDQAQDP